MNYKQLSIVLGAVVAILVLVLVYVIFGNDPKQDILSQQPNTISTNLIRGNGRGTQPAAISDTKQPANSPVQTDEIANWESYTNSKYSFSIKYPTNWKVSENDIYPYGINLESTDGSFLDIEPVNVGSESVFDSGAKPDCKITSITFGGRTAKDCQGTLPEGGYRNIKLTNLKGLVWEGSNEIDYFNANPEQKKILDQVLSTFKFTK